MTDDLTNLLYDELRASAARLVRRHQGSVAPSSLVHEVLIRMMKADGSRFESELHFRAVASRAMRQVLVDRARSRNAAKRGGGLTRVELEHIPVHQGLVDLIALDRALEALDADRPACAKVVALRVLGGMTVAEIAEWLEVSPSTVKREWRIGRAFLVSELAL